MTLPTTQAAVIIDEFGAAEVLTYQPQRPLPTLEAGKVLVKVAYAGINPVDYKTRQGLGWGAEKIKSTQFANDEPAILGFDMAGEVIASEAENVKVGDKVAALTFDGGCYAQYNLVEAQLLAQVPTSVALKLAGALPCVGITAKQMIDFADIQPGEHVVISAPAGGVGHLAVQLLMEKVVAADVKLTLICSAEKFHKLATLIDTSKLAGWIDYTQKATFPELNADVLLDLVGGDAGIKALSVVRPEGRVVVLPSIWADKLKEAGADKNLQVQGFIAQPNAKDLQTMLDKIADGSLQLKIQAEYPLAQAAEAHRQLEKGDSFGKIVLAM